MRLGIVGPAHGDLPSLARGAQHLMDHAQADKVLYVGNDDALDRVVANWARGIVGANPSDAALFDRAVERCARGAAEDIDDFVAKERALRRLRVLMSVPPGQRTIEILDRHVVLFVYDKGTLDTEDIGAAHVLVFGKSPEPLIRRIGSRTFVAPGPIGQDGGVVLLEDGPAGLQIELRSVTGTVLASDTHVIGSGGTAKMKVQGSG
ncbi:MAG: hypothetical protein IPK82_18000 [Polyangiaceae bacterium]|nr:hypothetical protein [Polyangiaceae bacterium]